jgi:hypothetical protein
MEDRNDIRAGLADGLIQSLSAQLVANGTIDPSGMSEQEFKIAALTELKQLLQEEVEFRFVLNHKSSVLKEARHFAQEAKGEFAIMFYATWIEHWLNGMYVWKLERLGKPGEYILERLQRRSIKQKVTTEWTSAFGENFDSAWKKSILEIAAHRNAFVHYKWQVEDDDDAFSESKAKVQELLAKAEMLVSQLSAKEHRMVYAGSAHFRIFDQP